MTSGFVRGFWRSKDPKYSDPAIGMLSKHRKDVVKNWLGFGQPTPCLNFVENTEDFTWFRAQGIPAVPFVPMAETKHLDCPKAHWIKKFQCIELALQVWDEVIWLDWDCKMIRHLDKHFWSSLREKQPWQSKLHRYTRYRPTMQPIRGNRLVLPSGGCIYFRDVNVVRTAIEIYCKDAINSTDEVVMALLYRRITGRWIDVEEFTNMGFDLDVYITPRIFTVPKNVVFAVGTGFEAVGRSYWSKHRVGFPAVPIAIE